MYLVHETKLNNLYLILKDGELKSNHLSGRINNGEGVYPKVNKFIYFSLERKIFNDTVCGIFKLYLNSELLYNRDFYLSTVQSPFPDHIGKWKTGNVHEIKIKHKRYTSNIPKILEKLYYYNHHSFYQGQIAIKNKLNIEKYLVAVEFIEYGKISEKYLKLKIKITNLIKKKYPNIIIKTQSLKSKECFLDIIKKEGDYVKSLKKSAF
jgi:hypothetical protein